MQEGTTDRCGRSHSPPSAPLHVRTGVSATNGAMKEGCGRQNGMERAAFTDKSRICLQHHDGRIRVWRHHEKRMLNSCIMHCHTGPAPGIMVWGGIGYHSPTPLVYTMAVCGDRLIIGTAGRRIVIYDLRAMSYAQQVRESSLKYQTRCIRSFQISKDML
ncbi:mitotic checkpoint protein BUB3 [Trichonephila clavipes]|nr:mitotic checkpoint protein BUB3 [Trichonephila clavipes]